jgi:hypothetical protein
MLVAELDLQDIAIELEKMATPQGEQPNRGFAVGQLFDEL